MQLRLDDKQMLLLELKCTLLGICPPAANAQELRKMLSTLPPDERHKAKRKWRKLKRTALKRAGFNLDNPILKHKRSRAMIRAKTYSHIARSIDIENIQK
jgi:hypothetical protein